MMPSSMTPGQIIREARLAHGLSLGQLASAVGRTASSVRRWEKDDALPTAAVLDQLADLLEIDREELEHSPDSEDTTATGGEAAVDLPGGGNSVGDEPPLGEILGEGSPGSDDAANGSDHVVEVVVVSAPGDVISAETATPAGVPSATTSPADVVPAEAEPATLETPTTEEVDATPPPEPAPPPLVPPAVVDPAAATMPVAVPPAAAAVSPPPPRPTIAEPKPVPSTPDTDGLVFPVPTRSEPVAAPPAPSRWQNPLRSLRGGDQQWRYYLRGALTVIVLVVLAWALIWAFGELFSALGELWDTFGRSSDTTEAQSAAQWIRSQPG